MDGIPNVEYLHQVEYLESFQAKCVFHKPQVEKTVFSLFIHIILL